MADNMADAFDPERTPVIIAVGQVNDRPENPVEGMDSLELMAAALRAADADGGGGLLADIDWLGIISQISFNQLGNLCEPLAAAIGASPKFALQTPKPHGDSPLLLLAEAANAIGRGEAGLAAVVGAEALRTAAARAKAGKRAEGQDAVRDLAEKMRMSFAGRHGLVAPVDIYPLFEPVLRVAAGQTLAEGQAESAAMWADMSRVAADNPAAWIREPVSADTVMTPTANNRMIAFPYTKLMIANSAVNQGAGFIVASVAEARRRGMADDQMIYVGMGAAAKWARHPLRPNRFDRFGEMEVVFAHTLAENDVRVDDIDFVELYSCFPCVPKQARRVLGWPVDRPVTVVGGLTFGGGPVGNYMSHAVAAMALKLRRAGRNGFLYGNGGVGTDHHAILLSNAPIAAAHFPQDYIVQAAADVRRGDAIDLDPDYVGAATVETYTVFYGRDGAPKGGVVVALTPAGARTLAHMDISDADMLAYFTDGRHEPSGDAGMIVAADDPEYRIWVRGG
jgi:acetyl-CoA C-acetyltransferase